MPPVAATPIMRYNGQTAGNGQDRSLQPAGNAEPLRDCAAIQIHRAVGAGHAPPATIYCNEYTGLVCRGGIYAARCSRTGNAIYRVNGTERSRPFPTTFRKFAFPKLYLNFRLFVGRGLDPSLLLCGNRHLPPQIVPKPQPTTIYVLPKNSARNLSKNSKNLLTKYDYLW